MNAITNHPSPITNDLPRLGGFCHDPLVWRKIAAQQAARSRRAQRVQAVRAWLRDLGEACRLSARMSAALLLVAAFAAVATFLLGGGITWLLSRLP
jgi:hypothetical protein